MPPIAPCHRRLFAGLAVAVTALIVYAGVRDGEFIWDDPIVLERQLPYFATLEHVFFPPAGIPQWSARYYRPLVVGSYLLDEWVCTKFWPPEARAMARQRVYHVAVVVYHVLTTLGVFLLAHVLGRALRRPDGGVATASAALFAVHPIHVESVAWMAGRSDVLAALFAIASLAAYVRHRETQRWGPLALSVVAWFAAALSKEAALGALSCIPLIDWLTAHCGGRRPHRAALVARYTAFATAALGYLWLRHAALGVLGPPPGLRSLDRLPAAVGWYVLKALWPPPQSAFVDTVPGGWASALGYTLVAAAILAAWRLLPARRAPLESVGSALFAATLAPSLAIAIVPVSETPLAERYLYLPSAGLCLAGAAGTWGALQRAPLSVRSRRAAGFALLGLATAAGALTTAQRTRVFHDNLSFWTDTAGKAPHAALPQLYLGNTYNQAGRLEDALAAYRASYERGDDAEGRAKALGNMGAMYLQLGRVEEALDAFRRSLRERPEAVMHYNWARAALMLAERAATAAERARHQRDGLAHLQAALALDRRYVKAHLVYGQLLAQLGRQSEGIAHLRQAANLAPASAEAAAARASLATLGVAP
jgi:tetratricopeptide (TPR) repeat protein